MAASNRKNNLSPIELRDAPTIDARFAAASTP
jgi:hypothetical protein